MATMKLGDLWRLELVQLCESWDKDLSSLPKDSLDYVSGQETFECIAGAVLQAFQVEKVGDLRRFSSARLRREGLIYLLPSGNEDFNLTPYVDFLRGFKKLSQSPDFERIPEDLADDKLVKWLDSTFPPKELPAEFLINMPTTEKVN